MIKKLRILFVFLILSILALGGLGFKPVVPFLQIETPTPAGPSIQLEDQEISPTTQIGNSDGIALLGILIFIVIVIPIWTLRKDI